MKKYWKYLIALFVLFEVISDLVGVGFNYSGSAIMDLKEELTVLHGVPYTGREVENGTEDMFFPWNQIPFS